VHCFIVGSTIEVDFFFYQPLGTQFGMLIAHIKESQYDTKNLANHEDAVSSLQTMYRQSKERFDKDNHFKRRALEEVVQLQSGNAESRLLWERICEASRVQFTAVYQRLRINIQVD
jgi:arginyl-tRNA synthetase